MLTISSALSASSEVSISVRTGLGAFSLPRGAAAGLAVVWRPEARRAAGRLAPVPGRAVMVGALGFGIVRLLGSG